MSNNDRSTSLQRFLLLVVVTSVALPAALTGSLLIRENFQRTVDYDSKVTANNYIELLEAGMTMPLWNIAADLGQPLIDSISIDPSVVSVRVSPSHGGEFLGYSLPDVPEDEPQIRLKRDIVYDGELLGSVEISYSLANARARAVNESRLLLTIIVTQLVFSIGLMGYFLKRRVIGPANQLQRAAAGIAEGDLKTSIPHFHNDEFGELSKQLERMRGSLETSFSTLEDRVRERTSDLVDLNKELKNTLNQLKHAQGNLVQSEKLAALGSLVAGVAHELNTPIGNGLTVASSLREATNTFNKLLAEGITRSALDQYIEDMDEGSKLVVASLERASELVSGFKQVAMDRTSAQRRKFNLLEVLCETRLTVSPAFKHTSYTIEIDCDEGITLDSFPGPLGQIVTNLLNNTLIHAFEGKDEGHVIVHGSKVADEDEVLLFVQDNGCGIPEENINRIFDPFFTTKLGEGGNGLGMHIVHNLVTGVLGGTIIIDSELNHGTTFILKIPFSAPHNVEDSGVDGLSTE